MSPCLVKPTQNYGKKIALSLTVKYEDEACFAKAMIDEVIHKTSFTNYL